MPWLQAFHAHPRSLFASSAAGDRAGALLVRTHIGIPGAQLLVLRPPGLGVSDYLDLMLPEDHEKGREAAAGLFDWLIRAEGWDLLDLPNLPSESPTRAILPDICSERSLATLQLESHERPFTSLQGSWQTYLASRSTRLRKHLRTAGRRLAELGAVEYRHFRRPGEVRERIGQAFHVHARRWRGQHTAAIFSSSARGRRFYTEAILRMASAGRADLSALELDGRLVAFCLGFLCDGRFYYYLPAFDPDFARFSPSSLLLAHLLERAFEMRLHEFDFMLGDEAYKRRWATGSRQVGRLVVAAPGHRGAISLKFFGAYLSARKRVRRLSWLRQVRRYGLGRLKKALTD